MSPIEKQIKEKIERIGTPLAEWNIQINFGIKTGLNEAFIITGEKRKQLIEIDPKSEEIIRPILRGRDIKRYGYDFANLYLLFIPWHFPLNDKIDITGASIEAEKAFEYKYPAVYNHLYKHKRKLLDRNKAETGIRYEWYALQRWGANYWNDFSKQKIVWGEISDKPKFSIDLNGQYMNEATTFLMVGESLLFLLAYLNSSLSEYYFSKIGTTTGVGTIRWKKYTIEQLLVPRIGNRRIIEYEKLVLKVLENVAIKKDSHEYIELINKMIYQEFGFTQEEISVIENL